MPLVLRPYQKDNVKETRTLLRTVDSVLITSPTGSGKTALATYILGSAAEKGNTGWFIVPKIELVRQTIVAFQNQGIPHGVIAAGHPSNPYMPVQICSVDTLRNRLGRYKSPKLRVWDEAHHIAAGGWQKILEAAKAKDIGLSATPERLDGKGLGAAFKALVHGPSVRWLIENKFLCQYRAFAPPGPNMGDVKTSMGDYAVGATEAVMDKPTITGDAIKHYLRHARGKRAVVFCVSVKHSQHVAAEFRAAGVVAVHLDGTTPSIDRELALSAFKRGEIDVLTNCGLFAEGVDIPALEVVILLRPTQSLAMFLQMVGRVLRPAPGKLWALILDHAGCIAKHGLPDDDREWSLEGRKKCKATGGDSGPPVRQCPKCYFSHAPSPTCPVVKGGCGYVYPILAREVEVVDEDLVEIDLDAARVRRNIENREADSLAALIRLGEQRNFKSPLMWAAHYYKARRGEGQLLNELMALAAQEGRPDPVKWSANVMSRVLRN